MINKWNLLWAAKEMLKYNKVWWQPLNWLTNRRITEAKLLIS
jgi:hypothetical protein